MVQVSVVGGSVKDLSVGRWSVGRWRNCRWVDGRWSVVGGRWFCNTPFYSGV